MNGTDCYTKDEEGNIVVREECENCPNSFIDDILDDIFLEWMCRLDACVHTKKEADN